MCNSDPAIDCLLHVPLHVEPNSSVKKSVKDQKSFKDQERFNIRVHDERILTTALHIQLLYIILHAAINKIGLGVFLLHTAIE